MNYESFFGASLLVLALFAHSCNSDDRSLGAADSVLQYSEKHRPQYHFSPPANWMNDPNGMVYLDGEYHLFYQYYPDSTVWGPMHWGHAISKDLTTWDHLPIALYPDSIGYVFSGSAIIDDDNVAGFGKGAMLAYFTHHNIQGERAGSVDFQVQSMAYSTDKGRSWTKYAGNPIIPNPGVKDFRDPKVVYDSTNEQWVLVLAAYDRALFYTSTDLISWQLSGEYGIEGDDRLWECPDLVPMRVAESDSIKWVLIVSIQKKGPNGGTATSYWVGDWDGETFIPDDAADQQWLDFGTDNYAFVTWSNVPKGQAVGIGWMSNWQYAQVVPTEKWRSAMTLPRELSLVEDGESYLIASQPVSSISSLVDSIGPVMVDTLFNESKMASLGDGLVHIRLEVVDDGNDFNYSLRNALGERIVIGYNREESVYHLDRRTSGDVSFSDIFAGVHTAPRLCDQDTITADIYLDHSSVEVFWDDGRTVMTDIFFPTSPLTELWYDSLAESATSVSYKVDVLSSTW